MATIRTGNLRRRRIAAYSTARNVENRRIDRIVTDAIRGVFKGGQPVILHGGPGMEVRRRVRQAISGQARAIARSAQG